MEEESCTTEILLQNSEFRIQSFEQNSEENLNSLSLSQYVPIVGRAGEMARPKAIRLGGMHKPKKAKAKREHSARTGTLPGGGPRRLLQLRLRQAVVEEAAAPCWQQPHGMRLTMQPQSQMSRQLRRPSRHLRTRLSKSARVLRRKLR